jgi:hypothetical protein
MQELETDWSKYISVLVYISVSRRADVVIGCAAALLSSDWRASL